MLVTCEFEFVVHKKFDIDDFTKLVKCLLF